MFGADVVRELLIVGPLYCFGCALLPTCVLSYLYLISVCYKGTWVGVGTCYHQCVDVSLQFGLHLRRLTSVHKVSCRRHVVEPSMS